MEWRDGTREESRWLKEREATCRKDEEQRVEKERIYEMRTKKRNSSHFDPTSSSPHVVSGLYGRPRAAFPCSRVCPPSLPH